jgi:hypothetical protein
MNNETYGVTAKRIAKGSKKVVVVTFPDGRQETLGGARAERATAVVVCQYDERSSHWCGESRLSLHVVGLRSSALKAASEAHGLVHPAPVRRSRLYRNASPRVPALKAAAVPVED